MFEHLLETPFGWLFITIDRAGIWFPWKGDEVVWTWPWRRDGLPPFISTGFSGTGEFGDARFGSLKEIDEQWDAYFEAEMRIGKAMVERVDEDLVEQIFGVPWATTKMVEAEDSFGVGDLLALSDDLKRVRKAT